jgi:hypothetical protein
MYHLNENTCFLIHPFNPIIIVWTDDLFSDEGKKNDRLKPVIFLKSESDLLEILWQFFHQIHQNLVQIMQDEVKNGNRWNQQKELDRNGSDFLCLLGQKSKQGVNNKKNTNQKIV